MQVALALVLPFVFEFTRLCAVQVFYEIVTPLQVPYEEKQLHDKTVHPSGHATLLSDSSKE